MTNNKKREATDDAEFLAMLTEQSAKRCRNDYDRYIELPNNTAITSSLKWWHSNQECYPDLARMARDVLAVPASGYAVE